MVKTATGADDPSDDFTDCPECGTEVYVIADRCPKCGHWFVEGDRRRMAAGRRNDASIAEMEGAMRILKVAAAILIAVLFVGLLIWIVASAA